jgi:hypothetical protein
VCGVQVDGPHHFVAEWGARATDDPADPAGEADEESEEGGVYAFATGTALA